ncbi:MAG: hypothetical protein HC835_01085 [Oscillatoriales cyanobacterium RM2_1_1]|nr:hypothetical protein [Oscillatoriales cyanobacterium SM2_3_0]NJO44331.1 hypothetical protein [Oscillatoriales cyanobacterium RM2_1_1]
MIILTSQEIAQFRSQLATYPEALEALDQIEDCEGDLEDAAISMAIHAGQTPTTSENWLDGLAKRFRVKVCHLDYRQDLLEGKITAVVAGLLESKACPELLVVPVVIYALKTGVEDFCKPLEYKLETSEAD